MKRDAEDFDTIAEQRSANAAGGAKSLAGSKIDLIWNEVQAKTRQGLGWRAFEGDPQPEDLK